MVRTAYVKITAKVDFNFHCTSYDENQVGTGDTFTDRMSKGDVSFGYVDPKEISSRSKVIRLLEVELADLQEDGTLTSISQASSFPRSKVAVERVECSASITELLLAL